ncbi:hypothetical protein LP419_39375 [Massilia sp. H-1]|nr:hypothetical protein LP419_39375 [Massilia sp. H-1]
MDIAANVAQEAVGVDDEQVRRELAGTRDAVTNGIDFAVNANYRQALGKVRQAAIDVTANAMGGDVTAIEKVTETALGIATMRDGPRGGGGAAGKVKPRTMEAPHQPKVVEGKSPSALTKEGAGKEVGGTDAPGKQKTAKPEPEPKRTPCRSCFVAGTLVAVQGGFKTIEDIRVGDLVLSKDDQSGDLALKAVTDLIITRNKGVYDLTVLTAPGEIEVLTVTDNHPFWVLNKVTSSDGSDQAGWVNSGELKPGMQVQTSDGKALRVRSLVATGTSARHV